MVAAFSRWGRAAFEATWRSGHAPLVATKLVAAALTVGRFDPAFFRAVDAFEEISQPDAERAREVRERVHVWNAFAPLDHGEKRNAQVRAFGEHFLRPMSVRCGPQHADAAPDTLPQL